MPTKARLPRVFLACAFACAPLTASAQVPEVRAHDLAWYRPIPEPVRAIAPQAELLGGSPGALAEELGSPIGAPDRSAAHRETLVRNLVTYLGVHAEFSDHLVPGETVGVESEAVAFLATPEVHERVKSWLMAIRRAHQRSYSVELFVSAQDVFTKDSPIRPRLDTERVASILEERSGSTYARRLSRAETTPLGHSTTMRLHCDYAVDQTQAMPIVRPVLWTVHRGFRAEVTVDPLSSDEAVLVTLVASRSEVPAIDSFRLGTEWGFLQLPTITESLLSTVAAVPSDGAYHFMGSTEGFIRCGIWIRVCPTESPARPPAWPENQELLGVLAAPVSRGWPETGRASGAWSPALRQRVLLGAGAGPLLEWLQANRWAGFPVAGIAHFESRPDVATPAQRWLAEREAQVRDDIVVELTTVDVSVKDRERLRTLATPAGHLCEDWRSRFAEEGGVLQRVSGQRIRVVSGTPFGVRDVSSRPLVVDLEVGSSGETGGPDSPLPIVAMYGSGIAWCGTATHVTDAERRLVALELDIEEAELGEVGPPRMIRIPGLVDRPADGQRAPRAVSGMNLVSPVHSRVNAHHSLRLEVGRTAILSTASRDDGNLRATLMTVY
ncbi:MAG: hypothetical protein AB7O52_18050 [Planctomycetota bacterium]